MKKKKVKIDELDVTSMRIELKEVKLKYASLMRAFAELETKFDKLDDFSDRLLASFNDLDREIQSKITFMKTEISCWGSELITTGLEGTQNALISRNKEMFAVNIKEISRIVKDIIKKELTTVSSKKIYEILKKHNYLDEVEE